MIKLKRPVKFNKLSMNNLKEKGVRGKQAIGKMLFQETERVEKPTREVARRSEVGLSSVRKHRKQLRRNMRERPKQVEEFDDVINIEGDNRPYMQESYWKKKK